MTDERDVEAKLTRAVQRHGGLCLKLDNLKGIQDRLVLLPGAQVLFVELKRPDGGRLSPLQRVRRVQIRRMGFPAHVITNSAEVAELEKSWGEIPEDR